MGEMFEKGAVVLEQFPQHGLTVILIARPKDMMMRAGDISDRVELNKSKVFDDFQKVERTRRRLAQPLRMKP